MTYVIIAAIAGAGVVTGLLFAFSNFVMRALAQLSDENGMHAMQEINEKIINPIFLFFFLGTPILSAVIAIDAVLNFDMRREVFLFVGAVSYLVGPYGITMLFNVPLNNRLAKAEPSEASDIWPSYQVRWQRWNHLRTYIGLMSIVLLSVGLVQTSI